MKNKDLEELKRLTEAANDVVGTIFDIDGPQELCELAEFVAANPSAVLALIAENERLREDLEHARREPLYSTRIAADRYRWLRDQHWNDSAMAVVFNPKVTVKLGATCPSGLQLDQAIDEERLRARNNICATTKTR